MQPSHRDADDLSEKLFTDYGPRVRTFIQRRVSNAALAEDVVQEAVRRALVALREGRVRSFEALPAFLFETAKHICQHQLRSSGREAKALDRFSRAQAGQAGTDPVDRLAEEQRYVAVREALKRLTEEDRDLLLWSYRDGLNTRAIAARLRIEPGAVRVRRHRALQRLRDEIGVTDGAKREL